VVHILKNTEINAVVIDIKDYTGYISYNSQAEKVLKYKSQVLSGKIFCNSKCANLFNKNGSQKKRNHWRKLIVNIVKLHFLEKQYI
jgi:hypothetical protein